MLSNGLGTVNDLHMEFKTVSLTCKQWLKMYWRRKLKCTLSLSTQATYKKNRKMENILNNAEKDNPKNNILYKNNSMFYSRLYLVTLTLYLTPKPN